jgi:queuine/archaeosine tRNA-ribosyltransferase
MVRNLTVVFIVILASCGGQVSDEQRKQMLEARKQQAIVKVTDAEIMEMAFSLGKEVMSNLDSSQAGQKELDLLERNFKVKINWLEPGAAASREIEQQLIDAYITGVTSGTNQFDNVQRVGTDSLLYTKVEVLEKQDGSMEVRGTWNIWISKKNLILSMGKK